MADVASTAELNDPANRAQVSQALSLIERGKAGAAGQDPALRPFVNALIVLGASDVTRLRGSLRTTPQEEAAQQSLIDRGVPTESEVVAQQSFLPEFRDTPTQGRILQSRVPQEVSREPFSRSQQVQQEPPQQQQGIFRNVIDLPPTKDKSRRTVFGLTEGISTTTQKLATSQARDPSLIKGAGLTALGGASVFAGTAQAAFNPVQFVKQGFTSFKVFAKSPISTTKSGFKGLGTRIKTTPSLVIGEVAAIAAITKAPKLVQKGTDVIRTRGLIEIPTKDVVAPEFFKGQTFPTIKKGQTAGALKAEFKPLLPGEFKPAGFTAAPQPFTASTVAGTGSSELQGVFQSPKVSPRFLRIGGEGDVGFSTKVFDTFRPTAIRITPESIELTPLLSPGQRSLASLPKTREFFQTAPKGKSFIPFIKTEKEAVIPAGTFLTKKDQRFFFKFEGRRVPIVEFEALPSGSLTKALPKKLSTARTASSSFRGIRSTAKANPLTILSSIASRTSRGISSSSRISLPSSRITPSSVSRVTSISRVSIPPSSLRVPPSSVRILPPSSRITPLISSGRPPLTPTKTPPLPPIRTFFRPKDSPTSTIIPKGNFIVSLRRFGKFKPIGTGRTVSEAFNIGRRAATRTLGATFRVEGITRGIPSKIPRFRTKKTKKGLLFIERRRFRLSTGSELKEIQAFKRITRRRKR